jgi:hypothetical protein
MKNDSKFVFCVKVSSAVYKLDEDVLIGVVYIPPEFTSYSSQDAFNVIYQIQDNLILNSDDNNLSTIASIYYVQLK